MSERRQTISLFIPAYNAAWCLPRLLKSAHAQTVPFDTIWVYDDCSTDDTAVVAEQYGAKVLRGFVNVGCSAAKNALTRHVETDWIHFHDADDKLLPNFVELARKWIDRGDRDVVLFAYEWRDNVTNELLGTTHFDDAQLRADPRRYAIIKQINPFCGLYRRSRLVEVGGYDEDPEILYNEDVAFHIKLAFAGLTFAAEEEIAIINYRVAQSMSAASGGKCVLAQYEVLRRLAERPLAKAYLAEIGEGLWHVSGRLGAHHEWSAARKAVELASSLRPPGASSGSRLFRLAASVAPYRALRLRERFIRAVKPKLRRNFGQ